MDAFSCWNKTSIWYKPTCQCLIIFCFGLIFVFPIVLFIPICSIIIIGVLIGGYAGFVITIEQIISYITVITGFDYDGKIYEELYNIKKNSFAKYLNILINYQSESYDEIIVSSFLAFGGVLAILLIISPIVYVIYLFIIDVKTYKIYAYRERSFLYMLGILSSYHIAIIIQLLINSFILVMRSVIDFIIGIIVGIIMFFEYTPLGSLNNYTIYNSFIVPKVFIYEKSYDLGIIFGSILMLVTTFFLIQVFIKSFTNDLQETYHDIEADIEYKVEKKK